MYHAIPYSYLSSQNIENLKKHNKKSLIFINFTAYSVKILRQIEDYKF